MTHDLLNPAYRDVLVFEGEKVERKNRHPTQGELIFVRSFKKSPHPNLEAFENPRQGQFVFEPQRPGSVVAAEDVGGLWLGVENDDDQHSGPEVFGDFLVDVNPAVARRANLDDEFRNFGTVAGR